MATTQSTDTRTMTNDDGTLYECGPHSCGYRGDAYCQDCGSNEAEAAAINAAEGPRYGTL